MNFSFAIPRISELESISSPTVFIQMVAWKVQVCKKTIGTDEWLALFLTCAREDTFTNWSYVATAKFKLLSFNEHMEPVEHTTAPYIFEKGWPGFGTAQFIRWDDLFDVNKCYVHNDTIHLNITILVNVADPLNSNKCSLVFKNFNKSCKDDCFAKYQLIVKNVDNLMAVKSPEFLVENTKWNLIVFKYQNHIDIRFATTSDKIWTRMMLVKLVSTKGRSVIQAPNVCTKNLISCDELFKPENGFVVDNSITFDVSILTNSAFTFAKDFLQTMTSNLSIPQFRMEIPKINGFNEIISPETLVRGIPWKVQVCKRFLESKQSLSLYLFCAEQDMSLCSYVASFSAILQSFNPNVAAIEHHYQPCIFDNAGMGYGDPIIDWNDLFDAEKCYVENDTIILDIKIDVVDPYAPHKSELLFTDKSSGCSNKECRLFQLTVKNIENLMAVKSSRFIIKNCSWDLTVIKHQGHLGVRLSVFGNELCTQTMLVKLLSTNGHFVEQIHSKCFEPFTDLCTENFIPWNDLVRPKNGFVSNNCITLEVVMAENPNDAKECRYIVTETITESEPPKTECVICLENLKNKSLSSVPCGHLFCTECIENTLRNTQVCPLCRTPAQLSELRRIYLPF